MTTFSSLLLLLIAVAAAATCIPKLGRYFNRLSSPRRRLLFLISAVIVFLLNIVLGSYVGSISSTYGKLARFGIDDHVSVLRLTSFDVIVRRLDVDLARISRHAGEHGRVASKSNRAEKMGVFVLVDDIEGFRQMKEPSLRRKGCDGNRQDSIECSFTLCHGGHVYHDIYIILMDNPIDPQDNTSPISLDSFPVNFLNCAPSNNQTAVWLVDNVSHRDCVELLNDILTEAYIDGVVWYDVIIVSDLIKVLGNPDTTHQWSQDPTASLTKLSIGPKQIADFKPGLVVQVDFESSNTRVFFHRSHLDIFGSFISGKLSWTPRRAVQFLTGVYFPDLLVNTANESDSFTPRYSNDVYEQVKSQKDVLNRYIKVRSTHSNSSCDHCKVKTTPGRQIISMSLFGNNPQYTLGAIRNAQLMPVIFPRWRLWIYVEDGNDVRGPSRFHGVSYKVIARLRELGAEIKAVTPGAHASDPVTWRLGVINDPEMEVFLIRDADVRFSEREAAAVLDWMDTGAVFHCIRDHPSHAKRPVVNGLWGARAKPLRDLVDKHRRSQTSTGKGIPAIGNDTLQFDFLRDGSELWAIVKDKAFCHDSVSCNRWPNSHPHPWKRSTPEYVGQKFDARSIPRQNDTNVASNEECIR